MASLAVKSATMAAGQLAKSQAAGSKLKAVIDPNSLQHTKTSITAGAAIFSGLVPYNPFLWVIQIPMFIMFIFLFAYVMEMGFGYSFMFAYFAQATITAIIYYKFLNVASSIVLGI